MEELQDYTTWSRHVIVCGLDGIGLRTVEQLRKVGIAVVVVEDDGDARLLELLSTWVVPHVTGDPRLAETLERAGLAGARAVVCVERTDLLVLETALLVRELRPDVRIVVELANPAVGRALESVTGAGSVLDVAELTAPALVEACLERTTHDVDLGGTRFVAAEVVADRRATLRSLYGDLAPVAVVPVVGELVVCPGRDHSVGEGDRVTVLGTWDDLAAAGVRGIDADTRATSHLPNRLQQLRRLVSSFAAEADKALRLSLLALVLLVATSSVVLLLAYRRPGSGHQLALIDAIYFTVETVATVGFGDFSFAGQARWLEVFGIALIVLGATLVTTLFALLTNVIVSRRIAQSLGRHEVPGIRDHVVVVGFGSVGVRVAERLLETGVRVVVVERDESNRYLDRARALAIPVVVGDATQRQTLESVNVASCRAVALLTSDDLVNIEAGLAARDLLDARWSSVPVVVRLFDRTLARTVERGFGFHHVRSTSELAAPWFVGAALGLSILGTFSVDHQSFLVGRMRIAEDGGLVGRSMADLAARTRVVALQRGSGDLEHPPRRGTRFAAGDEAYLLGPYEELLAVLLEEAKHRPGREEPPGPTTERGPLFESPGA